MSEDLLYGLFFAAYGVIPLALMALTKLPLRTVAALGVIAVCVEWAMAFNDAQEGAGELRGLSALLLTGLYGFWFYGGLWAVGTLLGSLSRHRLRGSPGSGARN
jgi:hypothetical protein